MTLALFITFQLGIQSSSFWDYSKTYCLPHCNVILGIYYIYGDLSLGYQSWHRPLKMAKTVYQREIGDGYENVTLKLQIRAASNITECERVEATAPQIEIAIVKLSSFFGNSIIVIPTLPLLKFSCNILFGL